MRRLRVTTCSSFPLGCTQAWQGLFVANCQSAIAEQRPAIGMLFGMERHVIFGDRYERLSGYWGRHIEQSDAQQDRAAAILEHSNTLDKTPRPLIGSGRYAWRHAVST